MIEETEVNVPIVMEVDGVTFVVGEEKIVYTDKGLFSVCFVNKNNFFYKVYKGESFYRRYNKKVYKLVLGTHLFEMPGENGLMYGISTEGIPFIAGQDGLTKEQRDYFRETYREIPQRRAEDGLTQSQESDLKKIKTKDLEQIEKALS